MKTSPKIFQTSMLFLLACLVLVSLACSSSVLPASTPTATLPPEVDSPLKAKLIGQWKVSAGGYWGDATLTFGDDGTFSIRGALQEKDATGSYSFTAEHMLAFRLSDYQATATIEFDSDNEMMLTVTRSDQVFPVMYPAERIK